MGVPRHAVGGAHVTGMLDAILSDAVVLGRATLFNLYFAFASIPVGFVLAIIVALGRASPNGLLRRLCGGYIYAFRGSPFFIQLFMFYSLALALNALGGRFRSLVDVTIVYPAGAPSFWQFLCGRTPKVVVRMRELPIPADFCEGDFAADPQFRTSFQQWLGQLWAEKDRQIGELLQTG